MILSWDNNGIWNANFVKYQDIDPIIEIRKDLRYATEMLIMVSLDGKMKSKQTNKILEDVHVRISSHVPISLSLSEYQECKRQLKKQEIF